MLINEIKNIKTPEDCQSQCFNQNLKCGAWNFQGNFCQLLSQDSCCNQKRSQIQVSNVISGYVCPVCWSTYNDCPCSKQERLTDLFGSNTFVSNGQTSLSTSATVSFFSDPVVIFIL